MRRREREREGDKKHRHKAGIPANKQASARNEGGMGGCEGQRGDRYPQESGKREVEGRQESFLPLSLYLSLSSSLSLLCSDVSGMSRGGEVSPAGFWPQHSPAKATAERKVPSAVRPSITKVKVYLHIFVPPCH